MSAHAPSIFSLGAAGLYFVVLVVCLMSAATAGRLRQPGAHRRMWTLIAFAFGAFALMRIGGFEEQLRDFLRAGLRIEGAYDNRRTIQRLVAFGVIALVGGLFAWELFRQSRGLRGRRNIALFAASAALAMMVMLMGLRIVSLHQIDALLYGQTRLNWFIDIGATLTVLASAVLYIRLVSRRA
ncbi:MAG: hypothetical protein C0472_13125 [Erythrobacter sp.]|nr:hypothetical protein [Erythrobacter sp.]MBA4052790.1 hypothetical protein [Erythrobacter sp.]